MASSAELTPPISRRVLWYLLIWLNLTFQVRGQYGGPITCPGSIKEWQIPGIRAAAYDISIRTVSLQTVCTRLMSIDDISLGLEGICVWPYNEERFAAFRQIRDEEWLDSTLATRYRQSSS